jgi:ParB-like chromosome segregation protein Spo0J
MNNNPQGRKMLPYNPIEHIVWLNPDELSANDYNPNVVQPDEMRLLELSIRKNGWVQPVLVTQERVVIDGYHRSTLARKHHWLVPCCVLNISEPERMLLTIRINRAKGTHVAFKMADIAKKLVRDFAMTREYIAQEIGASLDEVELLLTEDVFKRLDVENTPYSQAWQPKPPTQASKKALKKKVKLKRGE